MAKKRNYKGGAGAVVVNAPTSGRAAAMSPDKNHDFIINTWLKITQWLDLSRSFMLIGVIIFTISQATGNGEGDLAAYIWFTLGVLATWILTLRNLSVHSNPNKPSFMTAFKHSSILFPTLATLLPLIILIYIYSKLQTVLKENIQHLPNQYFWFNKFTFFLVLLQLFFLNNYYSSQSISFIMRSKKTSKPNNRAVWIAGLILLSILSSAAAIELYVIITRFLTDG